MREIDLVNRTRRTPMYCSYKMWLICTNLAIMPGSHQIGIFKGCTAWYTQLFFWTTRGQEWHVHQTSPESVNVGKSLLGNQIFWPCKVRTSWVLKLKESKFMVHSGPCLECIATPRNHVGSPGRRCPHVAAEPEGRKGSTGTISRHWELFQSSEQNLNWSWNG